MSWDFDRGFDITLSLLRIGALMGIIISVIVFWYSFCWFIFTESTTIYWKTMAIMLGFFPITTGIVFLTFSHRPNLTSNASEKPTKGRKSTRKQS